MSHESTDPVTKPRPVDGSEIVRLAIEFARTVQPGDYYQGDVFTVRAFTDLLTAVRTRL